MPELAEVKLARRLWEPGIGQRIKDVESHPQTRVFRDCPAGILCSRLPGHTLTAGRAHGKRLFFTFERRSGRPSPEPPLHLELHLGMTGRLFPAPPNHPAAKHDHFLLRTDTLALVFSDYRQFGRLALHEGDPPWLALPPEVLAPTFTTNHLAQLLDRQPRRALKALLLDQAAFPGVGNWMADEICWRLPCHPATPAGTLDPGRLRRVARQVCRGAIRHVAEVNPSREGATPGFSPGRYVEHVPPPSWLFQHRWKPGGTCPRCRGDLARATIASRTTTWCPACQTKGQSQA